MPAFRYWVNSTTICQTVVCGVSSILALIGLHGLTTGQFYLLIIAVSALTLLVGLTTAIKEQENEDLRKMLLQPNHLSIALIKEYQVKLEEQGKASDHLNAIIVQYDRLQHSSSLWEQWIGASQTEKRLTAAEHILNEIKLLSSVHERKLQNNDMLIFKTAPNTFRVTFRTAMRVPPKLTFYDIPVGIQPTVTENSEIGFTVVFSPASIAVEDFNFTADSEI